MELTLMLGLTVVLAGAGGALRVALGYFNRDTTERFNWSKAGTTLANGFVSGGVLGFLTWGIPADGIASPVTLVGAFCFGLTADVVLKDGLRNAILKKLGATDVLDAVNIVVERLSARRP